MVRDYIFLEKLQAQEFVLGNKSNFSDSCSAYVCLIYYSNNVVSSIWLIIN